MLRLLLRLATFAFAIALSLALLQRAARAQAVTASSAQPYPDRIVGSADLGPTTRSPGLDPYGVNYADCTGGTTLRFTVTLASFAADTLLAVWAGSQGTDCSLDASRTGTPVCWPLLAAPLGGFSAATASPPIDVRVQDLVGPQGHPPADGRYAAAGIEACSAQSGFAPVPMAIWFIPTDPSGRVIAGSTVYSYALTTDLVGPPPPAIQQPSVGDTMLVVNWTPNTDSDTVGYDVYRDPAPGGAGDAAPDEGADAQGDCPDGADGSAACVHVVTGGSLLDAGVCHSANLSSGAASLGDGGSGDAGPPLDDAGNPLSGDQGGIGTVPPAFRVPGATSDLTIWGESSGSLSMLGLQNRTMYGVAVAAVDGSGNVGPPSSVKCDFPDVVGDFFQTYRQDGGGAGCAITSRSAPAGAVAIALGCGCAALVTRRRRRAP
jgi:hypothetical protein